jgi:tetratricopeptide (TPR) repeat protein
VDAIERALEDMTDWVSFERLCCRVLSSEGYRVDPRGGTGDGGRDAIEGEDVTFQFSLREGTADKLDQELARYKKGKKPPREYVFVTNREVSARSKDEYDRRFAELGMRLLLCDRSWLSARIGADKLAHLRAELLAQSLINAPDIVRIALGTPLRAAMLGVLDTAAKDSLTDERLRRVRALMSHDTAEAERLLRSVLGQGGLTKLQEFEAYTHLGNVVFRTGGMGEAKEAWGRAIALAVPNQTPAANLATALLICERRTAEARQVVDRGLGVEPGSAALLNVKGLLEWDAGRTAEAMELFARAHAIEDRPEFLLNQWNLRSETEGWKPDDQEVGKAIDRYPGHKELLLMFANQMLDRFQATHEQIHLQKAGEALAKAFPTDLALVEKARQRSAVSPLDWEWMACALNTMAAIVYWQGDLDRASSLTQLALVFEDNAMFHFTAGQVAVSLGRLDEAVGSFEKAVSLGFDRPDLWCQLGNAHYVLFRRNGAQERWQAAAAAYERGARENPSIFVNLGQLCWDVGDRDGARRYLSRALDANPKDPIARCNALLYSTNGDPAQVLAGMGPIESDNPTHPTVLTVIGESHHHLGSWDKAYAYFVRAIEAAGPNSLLLEQIYPLAAIALKRSMGGEKGALAAMEFLLKGAGRLPENAGIQKTLSALAADLKLV